jgi:hypothetical protein
MKRRFVPTWTGGFAITLTLLLAACASPDDVGNGSPGGASGAGGAGGSGAKSGSGGTGGGQIIGTSGGNVTQNGVTIGVPAGAVPSDTSVTITSATSPPGYALASAAYQFGPAGLTFAKPITVTIPLTAPTPGAHLFWSNASGGFDDLGGTVSGTTLTGTVSHFSIGFGAVPASDAGRADGSTGGTGGQAGTTGTGGSAGASTGGATGTGGTSGTGGTGATGGTAGTSSGGAGGAASDDAGGAADGAAGSSGNGGSAGASTGGNGGSAGVGGNSGADASADTGTAGGGAAGTGGSGGGGTGGTATDAGAADTSAIDAAALCATTGLNLPAAKVAYVDASAAPDATTYTGGAIMSGKHYLTAVTHYGSGTYTGAKQAQYTFNPSAGTIQIGEFVGAGAVYIGMTYVELDAHTLAATVVCDTSDGGPSSSQFYYTVSSTDQGTSLTMTSAGSSDVLTIGPP